MCVFSRVCPPGFQVKIQVSKEAVGGIPWWIILISILIGLLILALVIFGLWKVNINVYIYIYAPFSTMNAYILTPDNAMVCQLSYTG